MILRSCTAVVVSMHGKGGRLRKGERKTIKIWHRESSGLPRLGNLGRLAVHVQATSLVTLSSYLGREVATCVNYEPIFYFVSICVS